MSKPCILTPITAREFPGNCTAGKTLEFDSAKAAVAFAQEFGISEYMISSHAKPMTEGQRFDIAAL